MKPEDFEQRLQRQTLRRVPAEWRREILAAAKPAASRLAPHASFLSTLNSRLSTLLWPHPAAWAGLAAVWIFVFAVNFSIRVKTPAVAEKSAPPSPEMVAELKQQQRMLAELIGPTQTREAEPPKSALPRPRSECVEFVMT